MSNEDPGAVVPTIESRNVGEDHGPTECYSREMTRQANARTTGDGYLGGDEQEE